MTIKNICRSIKEISKTHRRLRKMRGDVRENLFRMELIEEDMEKLTEQIKRTLPQGNLSRVEMNIVSHCNLNCKLCSHSAPNATEEFMDIAFAQHDFMRLAELSGGAVDCIHIMGGEPLLHPQCLDFLIVARSCFPTSIVKLVTNGILLGQQPEEFWSGLAEHQITLSPTKYPIQIDWDVIHDICNEYGVGLQFFNNPYVPKTMTHFPRGYYGFCDSRENFLNCIYANNTPVLHKGRLYPCAFAATAKHADMFLHVSDGDSINIHTARDMREILAFLAKPIPFCHFCNVEDRVDGIPWESMDDE